MIKTAEDMEKLAEELLQTLFKFRMITHSDKGLTINFAQAIPSMSHYLLDAYNEGYDDAIVSQSKRNYRID